MREEHPDFYEAYATLPRFREWLQEDVFQRTYQDYMTEPRDLVAVHGDDPTRRSGRGKLMMRPLPAKGIPLLSTATAAKTKNL